MEKNNPTSAENMSLQDRISRLFGKITDLVYSDSGSIELDAMSDESIKEVIINGDTALETKRSVMVLDLYNQHCIDISKIESYYTDGGDIAENRIMVKIMKYGYSMYRSGEPIESVYQYNPTSNALDVFTQYKGSTGVYSKHQSSDEERLYYIELLNQLIEYGTPVDHSTAHYIRTNLFKTKNDPWPKIYETLNKASINPASSISPKANKLANILKKLRKN